MWLDWVEVKNLRVEYWMIFYLNVEVVKKSGRSSGGAGGGELGAKILPLSGNGRVIYRSSEKGRWKSSIISMCVKGTEGFQSTGRAVIWKAAVSCREGNYKSPYKVL